MAEIITPQERRFLSSKRVLLSSPGMALDNTYYSVLNTTVEASEVVYNLGRFSSDLTSGLFGSQSQVVIPNSSILGNIYLHVELGTIAVPAVPVNNTLPRGWLYSAIDSISFLFGSSNISQLEMDGDTVLQTIMMEAETAEKRSLIFRAGGEEQLLPVNTISADVILPFPWSAASGLFMKKGVDTNVLNNPITIQIRFKPANEIYANTTAIPNGFNQATIITRQGNFTNKDDSLRRELMSNPELHLGFPFIHKQSFPTPIVLSDANGHIIVNLLSFINADLLGISFGVIRTTDRSGGGVGNSKNVFNYQRVQNVVLRFNGQTMFNTRGRLAELENSIDSSIGGAFYENSLIAPGAVAPFSSTPINTFMTYMNFAMKKTITFQNEYQNTWRISNNTLVLEMDMPLPNEQYEIHCTYYYNGIAQFARGVTRIFFD